VAVQWPAAGASKCRLSLSNHTGCDELPVAPVLQVTFSMLEGVSKRASIAPPSVMRTVYAQPSAHACQRSTSCFGHSARKPQYSRHGIRKRQGVAVSAQSNVQGDSTANSAHVPMHTLSDKLMVVHHLALLASHISLECTMSACDRVVTHNSLAWSKLLLR
jgi:hypothetical protein